MTKIPEEVLKGLLAGYGVEDGRALDALRRLAPEMSKGPGAYGRAMKRARSAAKALARKGKLR